jgi:hypothetical protein
LCVFRAPLTTTTTNAPSVVLASALVTARKFAEALPSVTKHRHYHQYTITTSPQPTPHGRSPRPVLVTARK